MSQLFRVLYDFDAEEEGEMTVSAGDIVKVIPQVKIFFCKAHNNRTENNCRMMVQMDGVTPEMGGCLFNQL